MKKGDVIRFSYTDEKALQKIIERLGDLVLKIKIPEKQNGRFRTAYIILRS